MYLISIYFDEDTNNVIQQHMKKIAEVTGNTYMLDGNVPPHITISSFDTDNEELAVTMLEQRAKTLASGEIQWVSVGSFMPYVLYITPVLNEYLHNISIEIYEGLKKIENISVSKYYQPYQWFPHTTLGKKLTKEQLHKAFEVMQNQFGVFEGKVTKIGLAKTNPYRDVALFGLKDKE